MEGSKNFAPRYRLRLERFPAEDGTPLAYDGIEGLFNLIFQCKCHFITEDTLEAWTHSKLPHVPSPSSD